MIRVVRLADVPVQAWKNGGGTTRELLAWPEAADWTLRLSVARIDRDGPFSAYPDISRWFAVLSGGGVELGWQDRTAQLSPGTEPLHFDGADAPGCRLLNGPTEDLNLMLRSDRARGAMRPVQGGGARSGSSAWRAVYTASPCTLHGSTAVELPAHSLAWDSAAAIPWRLSAPSAIHAWWIDMEPLDL